MINLILITLAFDALHFIIISTIIFPIVVTKISRNLIAHIIIYLAFNYHTIIYLAIIHFFILKPQLLTPFGLVMDGDLHGLTK